MHRLLTAAPLGMIRVIFALGPLLMLRRESSEKRLVSQTCGDGLEENLQRELNLARIPSLSDLAEGSTIDLRVREQEVGMVERVEEFGAELNLHPVLYGETAH